jgi:hypothetical protein
LLEFVCEKRSRERRRLEGDTKSPSLHIFASPSYECKTGFDVVVCGSGEEVKSLPRLKTVVVNIRLANRNYVMSTKRRQIEFFMDQISGEGRGYKSFLPFLETPRLEFTLMLLCVGVDSTLFQ